MATTSILSNVVITESESAKQLISALEIAEKKKSKNVILSRPYRDVHDAEIKKLFGIK